MEIQFKTQQQAAIADLLWKCDSMAEVEEVIQTYGHVAVVVQHMIELEAIDEMVADDDLDLAKSVIESMK